MMKQTLRDKHLRHRSQRSSEHNHQAGDALTAHVLSLGIITTAHRIASYISMSSEPPTDGLNTALVERGCEVVVPITVADGNLEWAGWTPDSATSESVLGTREPIGTRLGPGGLAACDVALIPALAVDHAGFRLGRGGGYYDRALANTRMPKIALLYDDEILPEIPHEDHDVRVNTAISPGGIFRILNTD